MSSLSVMAASVYRLAPDYMFVNRPKISLTIYAEGRSQVKVDHRIDGAIERDRGFSQRESDDDWIV